MADLETYALVAEDGTVLNTTMWDGVSNYTHEGNTQLVRLDEGTVVERYDVITQNGVEKSGMSSDVKLALSLGVDADYIARLTGEL